jgi:hypothetical protein
MTACLYTQSIFDACLESTSLSTIGFGRVVCGTALRLCPWAESNQLPWQSGMYVYLCTEWLIIYFVGYGSCYI